jgi:hypothetical protein
MDVLLITASFESSSREYRLEHPVRTPYRGVGMELQSEVAFNQSRELSRCWQ